MSVWTEAVITRKGIALLTKLHSGTTLSLTRAVAGAGTVVYDDLQYQIAVTDERQELTFSTKSYPEEGKCSIPLRLRSTKATGYNVTQIGVYAFDPDEGEILYLIAQASDGVGTYVPSITEMPGYASVWTFDVLYGQADEVTIVVDPAAAATVDEVQAIVAEHAGDTSNPHGVTAEQLGLGDVENTRDSVKNVAFASESGVARKIKNNLVIRLNGGRTEGTDMFTYDGSAGKSINVTLAKLGAAPAVESKDYPGCYYRTVDGEDEWINPPMLHNTEYRTTERVGGKPVYALCYDLNKNPLSAGASANIEIPQASQVVGMSGVANPYTTEIDCIGNDSMPVSVGAGNGTRVITIKNNYDAVLQGVVTFRYTK